MNSLSSKSFNHKIAFVSALIASVTLAVVFKLCLEFTCQSLIYANAMLSTSFTLLVCLKMYEMQQMDEPPAATEPQELVDTQSLKGKLSIIKDIQLSYVIPCIKTVINDMYDTFGWCVEPIYWLFEKYMQIVYPFDIQGAIDDNTRIEYVTEFCKSLTEAIDGNADIHECVKRVVRKFCINILKMELQNPEMRDVSKVIYALDMLTAELNEMQDRQSESGAEAEDKAEDESGAEAEDESGAEDEAEDEAVDEAEDESGAEADAEADAEDVHQINVNEGAQSDEAKTETISDDSIDYNSVIAQK